MRLLSISAWIFVLLLLLVALLFLYPAAYIIGLSMIALPILIAVQALVILKAKDTTKPPTDDPWYEQHN